MKATIGRTVIFNVPQEMRSKVNFAEQQPAIIVRAWTDTIVNLKIITDGPEDIWQTSVTMGDQPNQWNWPVIEK
jgi:hypothetical protein